MNLSACRPKLALAAMLGVVVACAAHEARAQGYGYRQRESGVPLNANPITSQVGLDQHLNRQLPLDVPLRDEQGNVVQLGDYFGDKPVIVNFVYFRCPMLCTQVLNGLLKTTNSLKLELGRDYEIVSISIDPRETPQMAADKKARYVQSYRRPGGEQGWHFLTADQEVIDQLTETVGFRYHYDEQSDQYAHASGIVIATPEGKLARYYYGIDYNPNDVRLGLVESSHNRIGTPVDQILLLCFHYDPATGKYGLVISRVIRAVGTLFLLGLGGFLWTMFRQERRRTREAKRKEALAEHCLDDEPLQKVGGRS
jgi:protein SCO1